MFIELFILIIFIIIIIFSKIFDYYYFKKYNIESNTHLNSIPNSSHTTFMCFVKLACIILFIHFLFLCGSDYTYSGDTIIINIILAAPFWGIPLFFLVGSLSNSYFYYKLKSIEKEKPLTQEEKMELNYHSYKRIILLIIFIIIIIFYIYHFLSFIASLPYM